MEEKEVTFNIVSGIPDEEDGQGIGITSDIDDNLEYLTLAERTSVILELIMQSCQQIISDKFPDNTVEEYDENDEDQEEVRDNLDDFLERMVYLIVNSITNFKRAKFGEDPQMLEFSLATYKPEVNIFGKQVHKTDSTYHSPNVNSLDPIQASFEFFTDTIFCLLNDGISKNEIKSLIEGYISAMKKDYMTIIDEFEKE